MPTPNEARTAIYMKMQTAVAASSSIGFDSTRISYDNRDFSPPSGGAWVRLAVRHTGRSQETLGAKGKRRFRSFGFVFVQVFTEVDSNMKDADRIAKAIADIFDAVTFDGLAFQAASSREGDVDGKWNTVIVEAPFSYDDVK